jgi:hypothetical protein
VPDCRVASLALAVQRCVIEQCNEHEKLTRIRRGTVLPHSNWNRSCWNNGHEPFNRKPSSSQHGATLHRLAGQDDGASTMTSNMLFGFKDAPNRYSCRGKGSCRPHSYSSTIKFYYV